MLTRFAQLFRTNSGVDRKSDLSPHRCVVDYALILVEANSDQQITWTIGCITDDAAEFGGVVLQILGSLVFVVFNGVAGCSDSSQRQEFAHHLETKYRMLIRAVHGSRNAVVGNVGGLHRRSYTAILDHNSDLLRQLVVLAPGKVIEA